MIMSMFKILCVTDRRAAGENFLRQVEKIAAAGIDGVILREKDLGEEAYQKLAGEVQKICARYQTPLILHTYVRAARELGIRRIHLPGAVFAQTERECLDWFESIGVSVHSPAAAAAARQAGATCLTAGHVFATDCKKGLPPRGTGFLKQVCKAAPVPVYAIGGINAENAGSCIHAGAAGVCLMSSLMKAKEPDQYLQLIRKKGCDALSQDF